jgi:hypothetical protein
MPAILWKSLKACDQFAALPPTPRKEQPSLYRVGNREQGGYVLDCGDIEPVDDPFGFFKLLTDKRHNAFMVLYCRDSTAPCY